MIHRVWGLALASQLMATLALSFFNYQIPKILWISLALTTVVGAAVFVVVNHLVPYVLRRLVEAAFAVWVIASGTFLLLRVLPGGPFDQEKALPPEIMINLEKKYHLNDPLPTQYLNYLGNLARGDLGQSYKYLDRNITTIIGESLPNSMQLGAYALIISYLIGVPAGVLAGWRPGSKLDFSCMFLAVSGVALPSFLMAPIFIIVFAKWLRWFEPALWEGPLCYVMPMVILGIRPASVIARLTRASVLEVIHSDFIRTARAKGLDQRTILFKHVLRNSLIPVLALSGPLIAGIITGSFVIEQIFAVPGIAKHFILSVQNRDYPLILATTLLSSVLLVLANLITDVVTAIIDPRVKLS